MAKKFAPTLSLGTLVAAALFVDLLWPLFLILGLEHVTITPGITVVTPFDFHDYPITHSLVGSLAWSVVFALALFIVKRSWRNALVGGLVVFSHWILDLIVHRPDLPLFSNDGPMFGFGVWNSMPLTLILEFGIFFGGMFMYMKLTAPKDRKGALGLWAFVVVLSIIYMSSVFGPPPTSVDIIPFMANAMWLFVLAGWWIDRHRTLR